MQFPEDFFNWRIICFVRSRFGVLRQYKALDGQTKGERRTPQFWINLVLVVTVSIPFLSTSAQGSNSQPIGGSYEFNIPSQPVEQALDLFAKQTGLLLLFPYDQVQSIETSPLAGQYSIEKALSILLQGTGLSSDLTKGGVIAISRNGLNGKGKRMNTNTKKTLLATLVGVFASGAAVTAVGQDDEGAKSQARLDEIIVTAQKREQRLQDVPISISAVSSAALEKLNIQDIGDLYGRIPSLYFTSNSAETPRTGDSASPSIRGIIKRSNDPTVGVYIDDIYQPNLGFDMDFLDLERLEVLRGPQGTLFGRNTLAGAMRLVTRKPSDDLRGKLVVESAEFGTFSAKAHVSGPLISDKLTAGLTVQTQTTDGYIKNTTRRSHQLDGEAKSARLSFNFTPTETLDALFSADYTDSDRGITYGVNPGCNCYVVDSDLDGRVDAENYGFSLTVNWELPNITVTSATGYRNINTFTDYDSDGAGLLRGNRQTLLDEAEFISEELRFASNNDGNVNWVVGIFGFESKSKHARTWRLLDTTSTPEAAANYSIFEGLDLNSPKADFDTSGYAVFGQATLSLLDDNLDLTIGGRYSDETLKYDREIHFFIPLIPFGEDFFANSSSSFSEPTFMGSASYHWSEGLMTYVTISEGFLSGGFQRSADNTALAARPFDSELSINYEVGIKGLFDQGKISYALSAFNVDMKNMQVRVIRDVNGLPTAVTDNAGQARSRGFEFEASIFPIDGLLISTSLSYTDTEFTEFIDSAGLDRSGDSFSGVPNWLGSLNVEYTHSWTNGIDVTWLANYRYIDDVILGTGATSNPFREREAYDLVNASVSFEKDSWKLTAFAENLFDDYIIDYTSVGAFNLVTFEYPLSPRQFGLRAAYNW